MRVLLAAAALGSVLALAAPANAQTWGAPNYGVWQSIDQRQDNLDRRIDQGVRSGTLTRREAAILRTEFRDLARLEAQYRRTGGGLSLAERRDLDRRFDVLSARIRFERHDAQNRGGAWQSINQRQANLDARIDRGVRNGALTRGEAYRLRAEFRDIAQLEARYRRTGGGLSLGERRELDRRFDALSARIRYEVADNNYRRR